MGDTIICSETYGSRGVIHRYVHSHRNNEMQLIDNSVRINHRRRFKLTFEGATDFFKEVFLPQGYPDSVSDDYLNYQIWDSIQAFMSRLMSTLSTQAVLKGIGVGDEYTTPLAATITWLLRDGTSMLGRIIFAWYEGTSLDYNSKQWRLFADVINDMAMCFDLLAAHVRGFSTLVLCTAGVCRALVEASGSATRAAFIQHQAKRGNLADVAAKDGSQETLVNLAGLLTSIVLIHLVADNTALLWTFYFMLTCLHLFSNYKAVRAVSMNTLNQLRLSVLVERFLIDQNQMPSVKEVNLEEPVILGSSSFKINLGCSLNTTSANVQPLEDILKVYQESKYILTMTKVTREIFITLHKDSDSISQLESCFQAHLILFYIKFNGHMGDSKYFESIQPGNVLDVLRFGREYTVKHFPVFLDFIQRDGWLTNSNLLGAEEWRAEWKFS